MLKFPTLVAYATNFVIQLYKHLINNTNSLLRDKGSYIWKKQLCPLIKGIILWKL